MARNARETKDDQDSDFKHNDQAKSIVSVKMLLKSTTKATQYSFMNRIFLKSSFYVIIKTIMPSLLADFSFSKGVSAYDNISHQTHMKSAIPINYD